MEKKPKILLVGPRPPAIGGITTFISDLLDSNLCTNFELISFATNRPINTGKIPATHNYQIIFNVNVSYLIKSALSTTYNLILFPIKLLKHKPDIIHIHTPSYWSFLENSYYVLVSKLLGTKVILHIHGGAFDHFYLNSSNFMKRYIQYIMSISNRVISLSESWKNFFSDKIGLTEDSIIVIRNGVNFSKYNLERKNCVKDGKINVLFMGGVDSKRKGVFEVIKAIPVVLKAFPDVTFIFVGKGQIEEIKKMCNDLGIDNNVQILGQVSDYEKIELLNCSDLFLLPSYAEGLPISILEAMAAGLPIISTTVGAIPEVIENGVNGYLINPGDHRVLAEKISLLLKNYNLRLKIGLNNVNEIKSNYDMRVVIKKIKDSYSQLI